MNRICNGVPGASKANNTVATANPANVPARRSTPRVSVVVKSGLSTIAAVMAAQ